MKSKLFLAAFLLCTASAFAQGVIQFNWQSDQNLFQASFQVTQAEYALGWPYGTGSPSELMEQTLTVSAPDHVFGPGLVCVGWTETTADNWHRVTICYEDPAFPSRVIFLDPGGIISECTSVVGPPVAAELGSWSPSVVPEPSCAALFALGLLAMYAKKATSQS